MRLENYKNLLGVYKKLLCKCHSYLTRIWPFTEEVDLAA